MAMTVANFQAWIAVRRARGETLAKIGEDLGTSRQAVQQWEAGIAVPSGSVLKLAELLTGSDGGSWPAD